MLPWNNNKFVNETNDNKEKQIYFKIKKWSRGFSRITDTIHIRMEHENSDFQRKIIYWPVLFRSDWNFIWNLLPYFSIPG